ncbi:MAG: hypothetical protein IPN58_18685 [Anaerolineales bacterium]|nr:hypothetical protein [Anaerolineales bacterium]
MRWAEKIDSQWGVILVQLAFRFRKHYDSARFFAAVPAEVQDAAYIDGCNILISSGAFCFHWQNLRLQPLPALTMIVIERSACSSRDIE